MTLAKETQDFLLSKFISNVEAVPEETADDWFEKKLNDALQKVEQISDEDKDNKIELLKCHNQINCF